MVDGDPETRWSTGSGDLALNPMDVDILWNEPHVVDSLSLLTSTLKGQLRLTDFDVFGGLHGAWDGAHPLAQVRRNAEETILVRFPAVRVDRLRIRVLGSHRPDNAFAHIAELAVYGAAGAAEREAAPSEFPPSLADAGHDPQAIAQDPGRAHAAGRDIARRARSPGCDAEPAPPHRRVAQVRGGPGADLQRDRAVSSSRRSAMGSGSARLHGPAAQLGVLLDRPPAA